VELRSLVGVTVLEKYLPENEAEVCSETMEPSTKFHSVIPESPNLETAVKT
jgi:hypothetical protein